MTIVDTHPRAPTSRLPLIAKLTAFSTAHLAESVQYLHTLYRPHVRGSRRRWPGEDPSNDGDLVRSDAFERAYAVRWLTALIAHLDDRVPSPDRPIDAADALLQQAAALLATCAGVAAAGSVERRFTFDVPRVGVLHVDLADMPLDNDDYGSVGAQTWGGACVLAEMIARDPDRFRLSMRRSPSPPLRILELGAGTGLVGLTVAALLEALLLQDEPECVRPCASVVLTDYHPAVLANLESNIAANVPRDRATVRVASHALDWASFPATPAPIPDVFSPPFDVVLGADIVYEPQHAVWIRDCLASLLARPVQGGSKEDDPAFHLVIPLRPTHTFESSTVETVFGVKDCVERSQPRLAILAKETIVCEAYGNERGRRDDDVEYVYYQIGWTQ